MSPVTPYGAPDKHTAVRAMFERIAPRYDLMNAIITAGLDRQLRRVAADAARPPSGGIVLDVGTGTGDLALALARRQPSVRVIGVDYTPAMLAAAPGKARASGLETRTAWAHADGQRLPFADDTFDALTSAFVLRNFADLGVAYSEMARVTRPGGRVVALEMSPPSNPAWRLLFRTYFQRVLPLLGRFVARDSGAYAYLPASTEAFLEPEGVSEVAAAAGLEPLEPRRRLLGSVAIHMAIKPR